MAAALLAGVVARSELAPQRDVNELGALTDSFFDQPGDFGAGSPTTGPAGGPSADAVGTEVVFGDPPPSGPTGPIDVTGTPGADSIIGTSFDDTIAGAEGDDTISGAGGGDLLNGGPGNDVIDGGDGGDTIFGGDGNDLLTAGAGNDVVFGGAGDDTLVAGVGEGADEYHGEAGNDWIVYSSAVNDLLIDMTIILYFVPFLYMFASLPVMRLKSKGEQAGVNYVPFGAIGPWLFGGLGFAATALSVGLSFVPPEDSENPALFVAKVAGGCLLFIAVGLFFYFRNRKKA